MTIRLSLEAQANKLALAITIFYNFQQHNYNMIFDAAHNIMIGEHQKLRTSGKGDKLKTASVQFHSALHCTDYRL